MKVKFNSEALLSLVEDLEASSAPQEQAKPFLSLMRKMSQLSFQLQAAQSEQEKGEIYRNLMGHQLEFKAEFDKLCKQLGMTPQQVCEYVENPRNFAQHEWERMQQMRRRVEEAAGGRSKRSAKASQRRLASL